MGNYSFSIIIPAYNESQRITSTLEKVLAFISEQAWVAEVIVIDDGSSDNTAEIVRQIAAQNPVVRLLENPGNRGKGYSVRNGILNSRGEILLFSDADLSTPIYEANKLIEAIQQGADVAIGSRWVQARMQTLRQPAFRQFLGRAFNILLRIVLRLNYRDTQCGFKAFTRAAAEKIFTRQLIERWGFDPELLFLAERFRLRIEEIPVEWAHDNRSKINPIKDGFKMGMEMLKVRWNSALGRYAKPSFTMTLSESSTLVPG